MWTLTFHTTAVRASPVDEYLVGLPAKERVSVDRGLLRLREFGTALGMPHVRPLRGKLWELRSHGPNQQHRILYVAVAGQAVLLLHGFAKKTQATPEREMALAEQRLAEWQSRQEENNG
jgi:phage-related protein